jgi:hypothetical protein
MTGRVALALLALALSGAGVQAAPAAAPWSIVESDLPLDGYAAVARDGRVLAVGTTCDASGCDASLVTHEPGGAFLHAGKVPGQPTAFTPLHDGAALLVTTSPQHRGLKAADVTIAGKVVRSTAIATRFTRDAIAASNRDGATAIAWLTSRLPQQLRVRVRRRDGGAFEPARTIASFAREGDFGGADIAVGPSGEIAVAWAAGGSLVTRVQDRRARRFGPLLRIGRSDRLAKVAAAFTTGGRLVMIWSSADGGEEQNRTALVRVATRRPGAMRFTPSRKLGVGAAREPLALARGTAVRAIGAGTTAMVAWTTGTLRTRIASVTAAGTVTGARTIDPDGVLVDAVGSTSRRVLVAWTHDPLGAGASAQAVIAPPGGRFGPGEPVGPAGSWATGAALHRAGTRALVTWGAGDPVLSPRWGLAERRLP